MVHPWGKIRLGPDDSRPDFRTFTWIAMMFSAGLGSALMFYGVVEPLTHWSAPPHGLAEPKTTESAKVALQYTYFHWGFNGWAMYAVVGGSLGFFCYRKGHADAAELRLHAVCWDRTRRRDRWVG